jgi:Rhodopirellula transposase DDE domain
MHPAEPHVCRCPCCQQGGNHPDVQHHRRINLFLAQLDRRQRRLYAAVESDRIGQGGDQIVSMITGLAPGTIRSGRAQLAAGLGGEPLRPDGHSSGRPSTEKRYPNIKSVLEQILSDEIAGDPMGDDKWVRNSVEHISQRLKDHGIDVTGMTVWRLLKDMGFSMKYGKRRRQGSGQDSPDRDEQFRYIAPEAAEMLILADGGGANGCRSKAWKLNLQEKLCDQFGLTVTVCHYPTGCSKWNPVERRLFSQISINWAGKPLRSLAIMLGYIRGTTTSTALTVQAYLDETTYRKGKKVSREQMDRLNLRLHKVCANRNYTLSPRI